MKNPRSFSLSKDIGVYVRTDQSEIVYDKYQVYLDNFRYQEMWNTVFKWVDGKFHVLIKIVKLI